MIRFTKENIDKILIANEGFRDRTYYKSKNKEDRTGIIGGVLQKRSIGKTSFSDSRYDKTTVCDLEQTRRFIKNNVEKLNLNIH